MEYSKRPSNANYDSPDATPGKNSCSCSESSWNYCASFYPETMAASTPSSPTQVCPSDDCALGSGRAAGRGDAAQANAGGFCLADASGRCYSCSSVHDMLSEEAHRRLTSNGVGDGVEEDDEQEPPTGTVVKISKNGKVVGSLKISSASSSPSPSSLSSPIASDGSPRGIHRNKQQRTFDHGGFDGRCLQQAALSAEAANNTCTRQHASNSTQHRLSCCQLTLAEHGDDGDDGPVTTTITKLPYSPLDSSLNTQQMMSSQQKHHRTKTATRQMSDDVVVTNRAGSKRTTLRDSIGRAAVSLSNEAASSTWSLSSEPTPQKAKGRKSKPSSNNPYYSPRSQHAKEQEECRRLDELLLVDPSSTSQSPRTADQTPASCKFSSPSSPTTLLVQTLCSANAGLPSSPAVSTDTLREIEDELLTQVVEQSCINNNNNKSITDNKQNSSSSNNRKTSGLPLERPRRPSTGNLPVVISTRHGRKGQPTSAFKTPNNSSSCVESSSSNAESAQQDVCRTRKHHQAPRVIDAANPSSISGKATTTAPATTSCLSNLGSNIFKPTSSLLATAGATAPAKTTAMASKGASAGRTGGGAGVAVVAGGGCVKRSLVQPPIQGGFRGDRVGPTSTVVGASMVGTVVSVNKGGQFI